MTVGKTAALRRNETGEPAKEIKTRRRRTVGLWVKKMIQGSSPIFILELRLGLLSLDASWKPIPASYQQKVILNPENSEFLYCNRRLF